MNAARFLRHVEKTPGCWYWRGNLSDCGHGRVRVQGKLRSARRVAYKLWIGPIPSGALVGVSCREKACIRPEHLELIEPVWVARLTPQQTSAIATSFHRTCHLARIYGVSRKSIQRRRRSVPAIPGQ